jgi:hypothetical protein
MDCVKHHSSVLVSRRGYLRITLRTVGLYNVGYADCGAVGVVSESYRRVGLFPAKRYEVSDQLICYRGSFLVNERIKAQA